MVDQNSSSGAVKQAVKEQQMELIQQNLKSFLDNTMVIDDKKLIEDVKNASAAKDSLDPKDLIQSVKQALQQNVDSPSYDPFATVNIDQSVIEFITKYHINDMGKTRIQDETVVFGKYKLGRELCSGGYGSVYECSSHPDKVIKVERVQRRPEQLYNEVEIQNQMAKIGVSIPIEEYEVNDYPRHIYGREVVGKAWFYVIVMKRLSYSLRDKMDSVLMLDMDTVQKLSTQLTIGLNRIHELGYIHCDLKPQNIMVLEENGRIEVYIIDFGLCQKVIRDGEHVEMSNDGPRGTYVYMSRAAQEGKTLSRRDDWESLVYVIIVLINGELPWHRETDLKKMLEMKKEFAIKQQWRGLPEVFKKFTEQIFTLGFTEQPDFVNLFSTLTQMQSSHFDIKWINSI